MPALFVPNPAFEGELMRSAPVVTLITKLAGEVATTADRIARRRTGHLANSIHPSIAVGPTGIVARVVATDFKAHWYEFGTRLAAASPYLRPALAMALPGAPITGGRGG